MVRMALRGETNKAIGRALRVSQRTVERYRSAAFEALGVETLVEAARLYVLFDGPAPTPPQPRPEHWFAPAGADVTLRGGPT